MLAIVRFVFPLACLVACSSGPVAAECSSVSNGEFQEEVAPGELSFTSRNGTSQVEVTPSLGLEMHFTVRWLDPCTYQIFDKREVKGEAFRRPQPTDTITVRITSVDAKGFDYEATSNFSHAPMTGRQSRR